MPRQTAQKFSNDWEQLEGGNSAMIGTVICGNLAMIGTVGKGKFFIAWYSWKVERGGGGE